MIFYTNTQELCILVVHNQYSVFKDYFNKSIAYGKIGPQCVLGVLCLILFLSVGMLFSNISIWELTCYK